MRNVATALFWLATLFLAVPAAATGGFAYAGGQLVLGIVGTWVLRKRPQSLWSDAVLLLAAGVSVAALLEGLFVFFPTVALSLALAAWNVGHRFGHVDDSPVEPEAKRSVMLRTLVLSGLGPIAIGGVVSACLLLRLPMSFGLGLSLSLLVFVLLGVFLRVARPRRGAEE